MQFSKLAGVLMGLSISKVYPALNRAVYSTLDAVPPSVRNVLASVLVNSFQGARIGVCGCSRANPSILGHAAASVPHDTHRATPNNCHLPSETRSTESSAHSFPCSNWSSKVRPLVQSLPASCPWTISNHHNHTSPAKSAAGNAQLTLRPR